MQGGTKRGGRQIVRSPRKASKRKAQPAGRMERRWVSALPERSRPRAGRGRPCLLCRARLAAAVGSRAARVAASSDRMIKTTCYKFLTESTTLKFRSPILSVITTLLGSNQFTRPENPRSMFPVHSYVIKHRSVFHNQSDYSLHSHYTTKLAITL